MTTRVVFYDVATAARAPRIHRLVEAAWERRKRLLIHCADATAARALDEGLWCHDDTSFLPHEVVAPGGRPRDADARVVIVYAEEDPISAELLLQVDPVSLDFAASFDVVIDWVDHRSPPQLEESRARFRAWRDKGLVPEHRREGG